jgi:hypothetical protein
VSGCRAGGPGDFKDSSGIVLSSVVKLSAGTAPYLSADTRFALARIADPGTAERRFGTPVQVYLNKSFPSKHMAESGR